MLKNIYIKNFVLIQEVNLDFNEGLNALIGETGAGKSILIDAISLLCADRASSSFVGNHGDQTIVEGTFDLSNNTHAKKVLEEAGFDFSDMTIFTREITRSGKSTTRINHRMVTLNLMKDVLRDEIDIHGQRDTQYLLNKSTHIHLLDQYIQNDELLDECKEKYQAYAKLVNEKEMMLSQKYNENDLEFIQFQLKEIKDAELKEGEEEELIQKEKQFKTVKSSYEKLNQILSQYDAVDVELYEILKTVQSFDEEVLPEARSLITDSYYNLAEGISAYRNLFADVDMSEEEINQIEERLFLLQNLKRKYGSQIKDILAKKEELTQQLEVISHREEYLEKIDQEISVAKDAFEKVAKKLSKQRKEGAKKLDQEVLQHLKDLSLPNAQFKTVIENTKENSRGIDDVEFFISMNTGEGLKPLNKTASGGELSRLMLGLKVVFSKLQGIKTIIFDEIDTGVSGQVASAIGAKMKELSHEAQVFTVTHLAPVAAYGDYVYLVSKKEEEDLTLTSVLPLNDEEKIEQFALMSSGAITTNSKKAANELLEKSQSYV